MMRLAINTGSFHYKYYSVLRSLWGFKDRKDTTSLCQYSQFIFWFTLATVFLAPLLILGWSILKTGRLIYKVLSWTSFGRKIIDMLDSIFGIGGLIDKACDEMINTPVKTLLTVILFVLLLSSVIVVTPIILFCGVSYLIRFFFEILMFLVGFVCTISVAGFYLSYLVGLILLWSYGYIMTGLSALISFLLGAGFLITVFVGCLIVGSIISVLLIKLALTVEPVRDFIDFKLNGFHKARKEADQRRKERLAQKKKEKYELIQKRLNEEIEHTIIEKIFIAIWAGICATYKGISNTLFISEKKVSNGTVQVLGIFGLLWKTLMSIKNGICPLVDFVSEDDFVKEETKDE